MLESVFVSERKMECGKEPYDCRPCYSRTASICQLQRGLSCVSRVDVLSDSRLLNAAASNSKYTPVAARGFPGPASGGK